MRLGIVGAGWLGLACAQQAQRQGASVVATVTAPAKAEKLREQGIVAHVLHVAPDQPAEVSQLRAVQRVLICFPPPSRDPQSTAYADMVGQLCAALPAEVEVVLCSSTGVYPRRPGVYTEAFDMNAGTAGKPVIAAAEQHVVPRGGKVVRLGGLMGYDRNPAKYFQGKQVPKANHPVNYVHRDDAVNLLLTPQLPAVLNAVSPTTCTRRQAVASGLQRGHWTAPEGYQQSDEPPRIVQSIRSLEDFRWSYPSAEHYSYSL